MTDAFSGPKPSAVRSIKISAAGLNLFTREKINKCLLEAMAVQAPNTRRRHEQPTANPIQIDIVAWSRSRMPYNGHVDAVRNYIFDGWAANLSDLAQPVTVELLVDGIAVAEAVACRHRRDLKQAQLGTGDYGFMVALPAAFYDGNSHSITVRIKGTEHGLAGVRETWELPGEHKPAFEGAITGLNGAVLEGYAVNGSPGASPVIVDLLIAGKIAAQRTASRLSPAEIVHANCGFAFNLAELWTPELLTGEVECRIGGTEAVLTYAGESLIGNAIELDALRLVDGLLRGTIRTPAFMPDDSEFEVRIDGKTLSGVEWSTNGTGTANGLRHFTVELPPEKFPGALMVEVRLRDADYIVGGSARRLWNLSPSNLITNAFFSDWAGDQLSAWKLSADIVKRVLPEHCLLDMKAAEAPLFGPLAVRLELESEGDDAEYPAEAVTILSQKLSPDQLPPGQLYEFKLVARAGGLAHLPAAVILELETEDQQPQIVRLPLRLRSRWSSQNVAVELPDTATQFTKALLKFEFPPAQGVLQIAAIGFGLKSFPFIPPKSRNKRQTVANVAPGTAAHPNAVLNGSLEDWSRGLSFRAHTKRLETADAWSFYSKAAQPSLTISLEKVLTRDPALAREGTEVFGLGLRGTAQGTSRLEALLDPLSLRSEIPDTLRFFVCRKASPIPQLKADSKLLSIQRVMLIRRTFEPPKEGDAVPAFRDNNLCVVARRIAISATGRYYELSVPDSDLDWRDALTPAEDAGEAEPQFLIAFEFEGPVDCVLADVYLGKSDAYLSGDTNSSEGFIGLEDINIANQVGLIKGIDLWRVPEVLKLGTPPGDIQPSLQAGTAPELAKWRWTRPDFPSVEVIIPVFNAPDEVMGCLRSIERNTSIPHLVTIIDDASDQETASQLNDFARTRQWVKLIRNRENLGYTKSSNIGMAQSTAQWIVLLNSDTIVGPGWLEGLVECAESNPKIKFVGAVSNAASWQSVPDVFDGKGKWKVNSLPDGWTVDDFAKLVSAVAPRSFARVALLNGFCTLMDRKVLDELGYLDEAAFPVGYGEENDLCLRAVKAGHELAIADHVYVYHVKSASFGSKRREGLAKKGMEMLLAKHSDVDLKEIQQKIGDTLSLKELREALREKLQSRESSISSANPHFSQSST